MPYVQRPYEEDELNRLFSDLGMQTGGTIGTGGWGSPGTGGWGSPEQSFGQTSTAPPQFMDLLGEHHTPKAVEQRDMGFWDAFASGLLSPVTDTLSGFGVTEPRELPTGIAGILGNIAGSIVGWTGITVLTAGIGAKVGLVGAGAAKMGAATAAAGKKIALMSGGKAVGGPGSAIAGGMITQGTGAMMAKGGLWSGLSQAHTWAFGQQEYENIPREALVGTLVGIGGGAVLGKFAGHLKSRGAIGDAPEIVSQYRTEMLSAVREKNALNLITAEHKPSVFEGFRRAKHSKAAPVKQLMDYTNLTPEAQGRMAKSLGEVDVGKFPKYMQDTVGQLKKAKNYGEIGTLLKKLKGQKSYLKGRIAKGKFKDATFSQQQLISEIEGLEHSVRWSMGEHISTVVEGNQAVRLPNIRAIGPSKKYRKDILKGIQEDLKEDHFTEEWFLLDENVEHFLDGVSQRHKGTFRPYSTNFRDPSFLPTVEEQNIYRSLIANVKDTDITLKPPGRIHFRAQDPIPGADVRNYIKNLKDLPEDMRAVSLADELDLKGAIGWFTSKLAPVRTVLGEQPFRKLRATGMKYTKELASWSKKIQDIGKKQGWVDQKSRGQHGDLVGKVIERDIGDAPINRQMTQAGFEAQDLYAGKMPESMVVKRIADNYGMSTADVETALTKVNTIKQQKSEIIRGLAIDQGYPDEGAYFARMYGDVLYDTKLKTATAADAGSFNTTPKVLKAAQDGSELFDEAFRRSGLDPTMQRSAYLPHFRMNENKSSSSLMASYKQLGLPEKEIDKIFWANELARKGGTATYDQNFFDAAERYIRGMLKQKHYEPVFQEMDRMYSPAKLHLHDSREEVWHSLKQSIVGVPGKMEKEMDGILHNFMRFLGAQPTGAFKTRPSKELGAMLAELQYASGMGFNPWLPVRNLTQKALAMSSITDSGNPIEGLWWMARFKKEQYAGTPLAKLIQKSNDIVDSRIFRESLDLQPQGIVNLARRMGASDVTAGKLDKVGNKWAMEMFRRSDISNVQDVFGAKAMYLMKHKGAPLADAAELARSTVMATQFMYGIDSPMLYKTPIGKQIGIFQSWPLNWANMLWEQGTQGSMHRAASTIVTMAVGAELLSMTGISFRSIHPTETAQGVLPLTMLEGEHNYPLAFRSAASMLDFGRSLANAEDDAVDTALNNFLRAAEGLMPFGTITRRTLQMVDRIRHDWRDFENPDPDFLNIRAALGPNREGESRLMRMLGPEDDPGMAQRETFKAWFAPTTRAAQRQEDWEHVSTMLTDYRRMRMMAVEAFIEGDLNKFQDMQERIVINFGEWIEPHDIEAEIERMGQTSRERQLQGLPENITEAFLESIFDPTPER